MLVKGFPVDRFQDPKALQNALGLLDIRLAADVNAIQQQCPDCAFHTQLNRIHLCDFPWHLLIE